MARVGFKKTIGAGNFDTAALQALFADMRSYIVSAGFEIIENAANDIEFTQAGAPANVVDDDVPHWWISSASNFLNAKSVHGADRTHQLAYLGNQDQPLQAGTYADLTAHFVADGMGGWWWLHVAEADQGQSSGFSKKFAMAGATSRRYPVDHCNGLVARYGVRMAGYWFPPYSVDSGGTIWAGPFYGTWSPLGPGEGNLRVRHQGSPLARVAVPQYPHPGGWDGMTACVLGELNEILALTDGYTHEEVIAPGWVAMVGGNTESAYAALAPSSFDVL